MNDLVLLRPLYYKNMEVLSWIKCKYVETLYDKNKDGSSTMVYLVKIVFENGALQHKIIHPSILTNDSTEYNKQHKRYKLLNEIEKLNKELKGLKGD